MVGVPAVNYKRRPQGMTRNDNKILLITRKIHEQPYLEQIFDFYNKLYEHDKA